MVASTARNGHIPGDYNASAMTDIGPMYDDGNAVGELKSLGQIAYEAYYSSCDGLSITGAKLPVWQQVPGHIQHHWHVAANHVRHYVTGQTPVKE